MSVTEAVRRLYAIAQATVDDTWTVSIGNPAASGDIPQRYLAVCYGGDDRPGVVGEADWSLSHQPGTGGDRYVVNCTASNASGDVDSLARLDELEDVYDAFEDALAANPFLDNGSGPMLVAGGRATMSGHEWTVEDDATVATVFFQVQVLVRW